MNSAIEQVASQLRTHYGAAANPGAPYRWTTLVRVVISADRRAKLRQAETDWIENGPLHAAGETAEAAVSGVEEYLTVHGRPARAAVPLCTLASWWIKDSDHEAELPTGWQ